MLSLSLSGRAGTHEAAPVGARGAKHARYNEAPRVASAPVSMVKFVAHRHTQLMNVPSR